MDDAFCRRLQNKFFIGRLSSNQRIKLMSQIATKEAKLAEHVRIDYGKKELQNLIAKLTTNFSGAALAAFRSRILVYFDLNKSNTKITTLSKDVLIETAIYVAHDFRIKLGDYSVPQLMLNAIKNNKGVYEEIWGEVKQKINFLTRRIFIDLTENSALLGFETCEDKLLEIDLWELFKIKFVRELIPIILDFCITFQADNIQLIDCDFLANQSAFDEITINETVKEAIDEFNEYENGIIIFDIDNLVGVTESLSGTLENESKSYSIQNQRLWQNILSYFKKSLSNDSVAKSEDNQRWSLMISSSKYLTEQFKKIHKISIIKARERRKNRR